MTAWSDRFGPTDRRAGASPAWPGPGIRRPRRIPAEGDRPDQSAPAATASGRTFRRRAAAASRPARDIAGRSGRRRDGRRGRRPRDPPSSRRSGSRRSAHERALPLTCPSPNSDAGHCPATVSGGVSGQSPRENPGRGSGERPATSSGVFALIGRTGERRARHRRIDRWATEQPVRPCRPMASRSRASAGPAAVRGRLRCIGTKSPAGGSSPPER